MTQIANMFTSTQLRMARHTLGLPSKSNTTTRNRYFAPPNGDAHKDYKDMTARGLAAWEIEGSHAFCWLTRAGALLALERGEKLCGEDFPDAN